MILHFLHYDHTTGRQFASYVINQFASSEMISEFVIISESAVNIDIEIHNRLRVISPVSKEFSSLIDAIGEYSAIIIHGLFYPWCELVLSSVPKEVKVAWMFWGGEIYDRDDRFLAPISKIANRLHSLLKGKSNVQKWLPSINVLQRIDYCLTGEIEEYEYAKRYLRSRNLQFIWYTYYSIEETLGDFYYAYKQGDDVCFCNSASITNNMFDALARFSLQRFKDVFKGRKVIMPLSYGSPWIRNAMLKICPKVFGDGFEPLLTFIPREEYNKLLLNCSTMILPHYRPAGQGNILTALWLGMRVYLSNKSMSFAFFKRLGVNIYSLESDFNKYGCKVMADKDIQHNREVLTLWYGKRHIEEACKNVVEVLK